MAPAASDGWRCGWEDGTSGAEGEEREVLGSA